MPASPPITRPSRSRRVAGDVLAVVCAAWVPFAVVRVVDLDRVGWWVVAPQAFALYVLAFTAAALVVAAVARRGRSVATALVGVVVLGAFQVGRVTRNDQPAATGRAVTVMVANLRFGGADPAGVVELVRRHGVDVVVFNELTPEAVGALRRAGLERELPFDQSVPGPASGGVGAYSRLRSQWDDDLLPPNRPWVPSKVLLPGGGALHVTATHAAAPRRKTADLYANDQLSVLPDPEVAGEPTIIAGDLNATLDNHRLRRLLARGYRDAAEQRGAGLVPTWRRGPLALTIDHILVPPGVAVDDVAVEPLPGSDHRALIARLTLPG